MAHSRVRCRSSAVLDFSVRSRHRRFVDDRHEHALKTRSRNTELT